MRSVAAIPARPVLPRLVLAPAAVALALAALGSVPTTGTGAAGGGSTTGAQSIGIVLPGCYDPTWKWKGSSCGGQ